MFENTPLAELAIGRSTVRQRILALLMVEPERRLHLREIQRRVGTSPGTASRELARLLGAGLIEREAEGVQVYFRAADNPVAGMMRQLLLLQTDAPVLAMPSSIARPKRVRAPKPAASASAPTGDVAEAAPPHAQPNESAAAGPDVVAPEFAEPPRVINPVSAVVRVEPGTSGDSVVAPPPQAAPPIPDSLGLLVGARFGAALRPLYGDRLKGVYLFGNRALGAAREDADVELLVALDQVEAYGEELEKTSSLCAQLTLELGLVVSRVFVAQAQLPGIRDGFIPVVEETTP